MNGSLEKGYIKAVNDGNWPATSPSNPLVPRFNRRPILASQLLPILLRIILKSLFEERQIRFQPVAPAFEMINGEYRLCRPHRCDFPAGRQQRVANARR